MSARPAGLAARFASRPAATVLGATVLGAAPLLVAVVAMAQATWHPVGDLAQATLRMHSFWSDPPLVGPAGRIGTMRGQSGPLPLQGNHPGPAMFWITWPAWRLLGGSAWAYQASVAIVAVAAYGTAVAVAFRRVGRDAALALAVVGAVLMRAFGPVALTQPWNPYLPLLPFLLFVVLCWLALCGSLRLLPAAVAVGSFCVQCHVGYAPAVGAGVVLAVAGPLVDSLRGRKPARPDAGGPLTRRGDDRIDHVVGDHVDAVGVDRSARTGRVRPVTVLAWLAAAVATGLVVWLPPIVDQVVHDPGNFTILYDTFRDQGGEVIGLRRGADVLLTQLDPVGNWLLGTRDVTGSAVAGALWLLVWMAGTVVAVRTRHRALIRLDLLLATLLVCALVWSVRLDSTRYLYLVEWFWVLTGLMVVSVAWSARLVVPRVRPSWPLRPAIAATLAVGLVASTVAFTWTAVGVEPPDMRYSRTVGSIAAPTAAALDRSERYLVTWVDPDALGGNGFGLLLALEERGFDVGASSGFSAAVEPHRVIEPDQADAVVTVVSGDDNIAAARRLPQASEVASTDHRTPDQRDEYRRLRERAEAQLRAAGLDEIASGIGRSIWVGLIDQRVPDGAFATLSQMLAIGQGTAVFVSDAPLPPLG